MSPLHMESAYNIQSTPKGYVLIINNETFTGGDYEKREGSEKDYDRLKNTFRNLGFQVRSFYNLNYYDFTKVIRSFALMEEHRQVDSCILFVMSHGHKDRLNPHAVDLATADSKFVSTDWIKEKFNSENCKSLMNKPKVMFFQACRDNGHILMKVKRPRRLQHDGTPPHISDLLVIHSCLPGYGAHRNSKYGAWFVQELCNVIRQERNTMHLISILNKVDMNLRQRFVEENGSCFQAVYFENWSFNKLLFLSEEAQKFYKAMSTMLQLNTKKRKKQRKKPSANKPLLISKEELKKALAGVIGDRVIMDRRREQLFKIPEEKREVVYLKMK